MVSFILKSNFKIESLMVRNVNKRITFCCLPQRNGIQGNEVINFVYSLLRYYASSVVSITIISIFVE